uniref:Uncharacterized protein n=1 Tax=Amphimedon queenslandica TaxID=400682 RepID=A0A1X7USI8_AMPQE
MLWRRYMPYIKKMKLMSDLCTTCKEISGLIIMSANMQSDERITEVRYPSSPLQAGPIYFLTLRNCGIFVLCCKAIPQQVRLTNDLTLVKGPILS